MSGAPVIRHSRVRPEDLLNNLDQKPEWMVENFGLKPEDVQEVLRFYHLHEEQLAHTP